MIIAIILSIVGFVLGLCSLLYSVHVAVVFQRFNDGLKDWARALDASTQEAINRSARNILRELDEKISNGDFNEKNLEPINDEENE